MLSVTDWIEIGGAVRQLLLWDGLTVCNSRHAGLFGLRLHLKRVHALEKHEVWRINEPQLNSNCIFNVGLL